MKNAVRLLLVVCATSVVAGAQPAVHSDALAKIRAEGLDRSQVAPVFETLTIDIGPRLTASPAYRRAVDFARDRLTSYGLTNVHVEPWHFGRGWTMEKVSVELIEPRYLPLIAYAEGWSPSTAGTIEAAPVFVGDRKPADLEAMRPQLKGAIVMTQPVLTNFVRQDRPQPTDPNAAPSQPEASAGPRPDPDAQRRIAIAREAGAGVLLRPSIGEHGTVFVTGRDTAGAVPSVILSAEHYNLLARMLARHDPVKLRVTVQTKYYDTDQNAYNVIGEIPGSDPAVADEVVMIGAHIDSWHTGVGATDNADGSTTVMEAMRILHAIGARPRRTIRVALWGGEEQGLLGSKAWVAQHLAGEANRAAREKFDVYFNIDNGTGPIYGWYLEHNEALKPEFDAWLAPFKDIGARKNVLDGIGATDHLSFIAAGVPGFNPIQSYANYDVRTHHTNMDFVERLDERDIRQAAIVMASFAYEAAMADRKVPRRAAATQ